MVSAGDPEQGQLDLVVAYCGRYYELDVKVGQDKLRPIQQRRIDLLRVAGCVAGEVRSVADAERMVGIPAM